MRSLQELSLRELLPPSISGDPDILAAADAIDNRLRQTTASIRNVSIIPRIRELTDSTLIDLLAWQFHVDFYDPDLPLETRRELVAKSLDWHSRKGTPAVVEEIVRTVFAEGVVEEWFQYDGEPYFFRIIVNDMPVIPEDLNNLLGAIHETKNTRSWLEAIILQLRGEGRVYTGTAVHDVARETARLVQTAEALDPAPARVHTGGAVHDAATETARLLPDLRRLTTLTAPVHAGVAMSDTSIETVRLEGG